MFALIDCNNFFVSCERLFRPDLSTQPIVVLSNNDGCIISRSNEAKALGIAMGEPYFKIKAFCKQHRVQVFSSNYSLYSDMSYRVMSVIEDSWFETEIYSVDEAFLDLSNLSPTLHDEFCRNLQQRILKETGIPTSIGIGKTKTLAKIANHIAKKILKTPVVNLPDHQIWLDKIEVGEVWGVGRKWHKKLIQEGIYTVGDLTRANPRLIRNKFNVVLMRTTMELQGIPCRGLEDNDKKQSIISSRSFGTLQTEYQALAQAVSSHCAHAYKKMRKQAQLTQHIAVFVRSNRFNPNLPQYYNSIDFKLVQATDDLRYLTYIAKFCLKKIYKKGIHYQKVGVLFNHLQDKNYHQFDLFNQPSQENLLKTEQVMSVLDAINQKFGSHSIYLAAEGCDKPWAMKQTMKSPSYTTQWNELPVVK